MQLHTTHQKQREVSPKCFFFFPLKKFHQSQHLALQQRYSVFMNFSFLVVHQFQNKIIFLALLQPSNAYLICISIILEAKKMVELPSRKAVHPSPLKSQVVTCQSITLTTRVTQGKQIKKFFFRIASINDTIREYLRH